MIDGRSTPTRHGGKIELLKTYVHCLFHHSVGFYLMSTDTLCDGGSE